MTTFEIPLRCDECIFLNQWHGSPQRCGLFKGVIVEQVWHEGRVSLVRCSQCIEAYPSGGAVIITANSRRLK